MELLNATRMKAAYTMGMKPDGRELLVVVVKGTFTIPGDPRTLPSLASIQADFVTADQFSGAPGFSAPAYESDFAPFKPRCDVLLNGSAHAPAGRPTERFLVGLRVGELSKSFEVIGDRFWRRDFVGLTCTPPVPFLKMPVSYNNAYGGYDTSHADPAKHAAMMQNPVGKGYHVNDAKESIDGKPLPGTGETGNPVTAPTGNYRPMAFGVLGRGWQPRLKYAGTYDQKWTDEVFPFLPADFDERHYQSAPEDQQLKEIRGGEEVVLLNLTPQGRTAFQVPKLNVPVTFYLKDGTERQVAAVNDTLIIEPDLGRLIMLWRTFLPLRRNMFEVARVVVGTMPRAWYRAREVGKTWYPSLETFIERKKARRAAADEEARP